MAVHIRKNRNASQLMSQPNLKKLGKVEIWWVNAREAAVSLEQFSRETGLLSVQDSEGRSDESRWARLILRFALSRYGDQDLIKCPIEVAQQGRPYLVGRDGPTFSISHSTDHIAVAIATSGPIGIDIEHNRQIKMSTNRQMQIAEQARTHGLAAVSDTGSNITSDSFLSLWTKLEAFAKARGDGIGAVLTELKTLPGNKPGDLFSKVGTTDIQVRPLLLASEFTGALVTAKDQTSHDIYALPHNISELLAQFEDNRAR